MNKHNALDTQLLSSSTATPSLASPRLNVQTWCGGRAFSPSNVGQHRDDEHVSKVTRGQRSRSSTNVNSQFV